MMSDAPKLGFHQFCRETRPARDGIAFVDPFESLPVPPDSAGKSVRFVVFFRFDNLVAGRHYRIVVHPHRDDGSRAIASAAITGTSAVEDGTVSAEVGFEMAPPWPPSHYDFHLQIGATRLDPVRLPVHRTDDSNKP